MHKSLHSGQYRDVLDQLKELRRSRGLRQSDLARRLGRAQSLVSRVESGERRLDIVELWVWLLALQTDLVSFSVELEQRLTRHGLSLQDTLADKALPSAVRIVRQRRPRPR